MKKIPTSKLENIQGGNCFLSSWVAVAGAMTMNFALVHVGSLTFYGCVRYL